jgi:hypothetical protein
MSLVRCGIERSRPDQCLLLLLVVAEVEKRGKLVLLNLSGVLRRKKRPIPLQDLLAGGDDLPDLVGLLAGQGVVDPLGRLLKRFAHANASLMFGLV